MPADKPQKPQSDAELLAMLKASGILNPNVTLDEVMKLSAKLEVAAAGRRGFIFRRFVYRRCSSQAPVHARTPRYPASARRTKPRLAL